MRHPMWIELTIQSVSRSLTITRRQYCISAQSKTMKYLGVFFRLQFIGSEFEPFYCRPEPDEVNFYK